MFSPLLTPFKYIAGGGDALSTPSKNSKVKIVTWFHSISCYNQDYGINTDHTADWYVCVKYTPKLWTLHRSLCCSVTCKYNQSLWWHKLITCALPFNTLLPVVKQALTNMRRDWLVSTKVGICEQPLCMILGLQVDFLERTLTRVVVVVAVVVVVVIIIITTLTSQVFASWWSIWFPNSDVCCWNLTINETRTRE